MVRVYYISPLWPQLPYLTSTSAAACYPRHRCRLQSAAGGGGDAGEETEEVEEGISIGGEHDAEDDGKAEVVKHECLADERFFLIAKGQERFRISSIARTKPYLVANISFLEDRPQTHDPSSSPHDEEEEDIEALASKMEKLMKDVIRISNRLNGKEKKEEEEVDIRRGQFPTMFSFFVGSTFEGAPKEQQELLEMEDTCAMLKRERKTLKNTLREEEEGK